MLELILLQLEGLEIILQPIINTQWLGCPDDCIVQGSQRHETINFFLSPLFFILVGIGITSGLLLKFRSLIVRRKIKQKQEVSQQLIEEPQPKKMLDFGSKVNKDKQEKRAFLALEKLQKTTVDPQEAFNQWVGSLDPSHPQTENIKTVHTETKEENIVIPEQKVLNEIKEFPTSKEVVPDVKQYELEKDIDKVQELMKKEHLTEDEAVTKIIEESSQVKTEEFIDVDQDIFSQDIPPREKFVELDKFLKKIKFRKKEKPKTVAILTELGTKRRDEYAKIINAQMLEWIFPLERYKRNVTDNKGKSSTVVVNEIADERIHEEIKKFSLFCSMAEFMVDSKTKKKIYWKVLPIKTG